MIDKSSLSTNSFNLVNQLFIFFSTFTSDFNQLNKFGNFSLIIFLSLSSNLYSKDLIISKRLLILIDKLPFNVSKLDIPCCCEEDELFENKFENLFMFSKRSNNKFLISSFPNESINLFISS